MDKKLWKKAVSFHGHECPGLAIGFRVCEAAAEKLGIGFSDDEDIVCVTENDACGVDAVQAIFSCTLGKGNLIYRDTGKQAFSFFNRNNKKRIRIYLKARNQKELEREQWKKYLLAASTDELFSFSKPLFLLPERAKIFISVYCEICGEGAPEHKMHLQDGKTVCRDCFKSYDRGWR